MQARRWRCVAASLSAATALAACSDAGVRPERTETRSMRIIKGRASDETQDAVVLLQHISGLDVGECTGTLLAANVVLTARHCVAQTGEVAFACNADGTGTAGGAIAGDFKPESIYVYTGVTRAQLGNVKTAKAHGAQIFSDKAKNLCNHDLAVLVLDRTIENATIAQIRLDSTPEQGETFTAIGWGLTTSSVLPSTRQQRTGLTVAHLGPFVDDATFLQIPNNEFEVGESICQGDSGGPAVADSGAVIGVVSRGGNGRGDANAPSSACIDPDAINFYTQTAPFKELIMQAFQAAGVEPWIEGGPDPRLAKFGEGCDANEACRSNLCLSDKKVCTQSCADASECPNGYECLTRTEGKVCGVKPPQTNVTTSGCAVGSRKGHGPIALGLGLVALVLARRRRSR